ncbi:MAG: hypothetical protein LBR79_03220 [Oscillospiraceae bacterium]|jgi:hypothetical protein|nr:hypothetical protein [Oscillospiraceae bacterium]
MKYTKMLCWVRPHEKKELIKAANGQFSLNFAKNYDDFKNKIKKNDYLVMSLAKARCGRKIFDLVNLFHNYIFHLYEIRPEEVNTNSGFKLMSENNVIDDQYGAKELHDNYLGIIPDLWEKRKIRKLFLTANETGEFAEKLVAKYYNAKQLTASSKSADLKTKNNKLIQVMSRKLEFLTTTTLNVIRSWDFDFLVVVLFSKEGNILKATQLDSIIAKNLSKWNERQNGYILTTSKELLENKNILDITIDLQKIINGEFVVFSEGKSPGMENKSKDENIKKDLEIVKAYLIDGLSYREIEKMILRIDSPVRGGGFKVMTVLYELGINGEKKGVLRNNSIENEIKMLKGFI